MMNWNTLNNTRSEAVLAGGLLEELLGELGCGLRWDGTNRLRGPCPVHRGDGLNFVVSTGGHTLPIRWSCHSRGCHRSPKLKNNLLGLVRGALTDNSSRPATLGQALKFVDDFLRRAGASTRPAPSHSPRQPASKTLALTRDQVRDALDIPCPYFLSRGYDSAVLSLYDIGYSRKLGRAVAPVYDDAGETCVGFVSRTVEPVDDVTSPRWKFPSGFSKGSYLFGYHQARAATAPFVLLVEGVPDVLRAAEAGVPAVACFGTALTDTQSIKLARLERRVVVTFDNDRAGREGAVIAAESLRSVRVEVAVLHPPAAYKDVGEMPAEGMREWGVEVPIAC